MSTPFSTKRSQHQDSPHYRGSEYRRLQALNNSGHTGVIFLEADDDQAEVNIMVIGPDDIS
jgi:hypothetical protein